MPRNEFGRDLRFLQEELPAVGSTVEKAIANAVDGLKRRDLDLSRHGPARRDQEPRSGEFVRHP